MTSPSKAQARMVPADQPEYDDERQAVAHWLDRNYGPSVWLAGNRGHDWLAAADAVLEVVRTNAPHAARPAAPSVPATPAAGVGTSGSATEAQIAAHEPGLGDALRAMAAVTPHGTREGVLREFADRADALHEADKRADRLAAQIDHVRAIAALDTTPLLTATQLRQAVDGDS